MCWYGDMSVIDEGLPGFIINKGFQSHDWNKNTSLIRHLAFDWNAI